MRDISPRTARRLLRYMLAGIGGTMARALNEHVVGWRSWLVFAFGAAVTLAVTAFLWPPGRQDAES